MPVTGATATAWHRLVRNIRVVRGAMRFTIEIAPRFGYGRTPHQAPSRSARSGTSTRSHAPAFEEARLTFEKMLTYASPLGLYAEEIGSTGEQLGNFPQAFSHLSLISAAINLDHQLDHGAGAVGAS